MDFKENKAPLWLPLTAALVYALLYVAWFSLTPLGQVPVLDGRENIDLARAIAERALASEPFYRAMGWPLLLSSGAALGLGDPDMMLLAGLLNSCFHALAAGMVARLSCWVVGGGLTGAWAGLIAGLLYALHPVAVFFAGEPLDTTAGLSLMVLGLGVALIGSRPTAAAAAGGLLMAAALVRPHALPVLFAVLALHLAGLLSGFFRRPVRVQDFSRVGYLVLGALPLATAYLLWQSAIGGGWGLLPWQGAYNLFKANGPDQNARSLVQKALLDDSELIDSQGRARNPTRVESEKRFLAETGRANASISEMNAHWRSRTFAFVAEDPWRWIRLVGRKVVYLLNDFEQYNNKTYAYHRAECPLLRWNPISWGLLFTLAAGGVAALPRPAWGRLAPLLLAAAAYAAGVLLFLASDRFRLPLAPICAIFAGGLATLWTPANTPRASRFLAPLLAMALAAAATFPPWLDARSTSTFLQDRLLSARAAMVIGDDAEALRHIREAEQQEPDRPDIIRLEAAAVFNLHMAGSSPVPEREWARLLGRLMRIDKPGARERFIAGVALLQVGRVEEGMRLLGRLASRQPDSQAGRDAAALLILAGRGDLLPAPLLPTPAQGPESRMTRAALAEMGLGPADDRMSKEQKQRLLGPAMKARDASGQ